MDDAGHVLVDSLHVELTVGGSRQASLTWLAEETLGSLDVGGLMGVTQVPPFVTDGWIGTGAGGLDFDLCRIWSRDGLGLEVAVVLACLGGSLFWGEQRECVALEHAQVDELRLPLLQVRDAEGGDGHGAADGLRK